MQHSAEDSAPRELLTVRQFAQRFPAWTEPALRNLILHSENRFNSRGAQVPGNGLREVGAVVNVGRRVLIDVRAFFGPWIASQQLQRHAQSKEARFEDVRA